MTGKYVHLSWSPKVLIQKNKKVYETKRNEKQKSKLKADRQTDMLTQPGHCLHHLLPPKTSKKNSYISRLFKYVMYNPLISYVLFISSYSRFMLCDLIFIYIFCILCISCCSSL